MADLFDNPLGLDGFEFIEFCAPEKGLLEPVFEERTTGRAEVRAIFRIPRRGKIAGCVSWTAS